MKTLNFIDKSPLFLRQNLKLQKEPPNDLCENLPHHNKSQRIMQLVQ
jgi:hypothetical protein